MKPRSFLALGLLIVLLLVSCAPAESHAPAQPEAPVQTEAPMAEEPMTEEPQAPATPPTVETEVPMAATEAPPTEAPIEVPQPIATSRGPDLEATDPATVKLESGELQLVEFFRYT
jgi:hypothetical protein